MAEISKITALDGTTYDIKDIYAREGIPFGIVDSTSTSTAFTATVPGITEYRDGTCVLLKNGVVTSAETFTININGLGAKPSYNNMAAATRDTTIFNANYTMLFVYDSTRVSGGAWICYRGYNSDTNTIGYQLRTNSTIMQTTDTCRYYKMFFTSADGQKLVPASANSTNNATSARTVNQTPIDPFGRISYTSASTKYSANTDVAAATLWEQYNLTLGYSFNRTGSALTLTSKAPIYLKCAPQTNGSAIMDADTPIVQTLPSSADGKIYIFLGIATSATAMELIPMHPVYYYDGTGIRIWTGKAIPTKVSELSNDLNFVDAAGASAAAPVQSVNGQTGSVSIAIPSKVSDLSNDLNFVDAAGASAAAPVKSVNGQTGAVSIAIPSKASDVGALPSNTTYVSTVNGTSGAVTIHGLPSGGTNGQSLVKTGSTDYAVAWATVSGGGGIAENGLPAGGTAGQFLKKTGTTNYDATWATVTIPSTAADVGALPSSTTYVSSVNGSSGAVTLSIPSVSVSQSLTSGTKIGQITINGATTSLYAPTDTDTKVTQTATASSTYTYWRPLVIGDSSTSTETGAFATSTNEVRVFDILRVQPSTGTIKALNFKGNLTGDVTGTASGNLTSNSTLNPAKLSGVAANTTNFLRSDGTWQKPTIDNITGKQHGIMEMLNPFDPGQGKIYIDRLENAFYFLDKRYSVTGYIEDGEGNQTALTTAQIATMFDMSEVDSKWPAAGKKAVITMDFTGASGTGTFPNYPYGYLCINFYYTSAPASVSARVYGKHTGTTPYWADLTVTDVSNGTAQLRYIAAQGVMYNMMKLEVTIQAKSDANASMSEISYYLTRSSYNKDMPYFSKLKAEKLYFSPTAPDYLLANGTSIATALGTIPSASSATPQALGTASAGSSSDYSRSDHVHEKPTYSATEIDHNNEPISDILGGEQTASGNIVTFTDVTGGNPFTALTVDINPVQSGSGDPSPSNVRPISGQSEATLIHTGKNMIVLPVIPYNQLYGTITDFSKLFWIKAGTYTISYSCNATHRIFIKLEDKNGNLLSDDAHKPNNGTYYNTGYAGWYWGSDLASGEVEKQITIAEDCYIRFGRNFSDPDNIEFTNVQLEAGTTATEYEPYSGVITTFDLDGTYYGGTLNVLTGELTVDYTGGVLDGSEGWQQGSGATWFYRGVSGTYRAGVSAAYTSHFKSVYNQVNSAWMIYGQIHVQPDTTIAPSGNTAEGLAEFKAWLAQNPVTFYTKLVTPLVIQLTPHEMKSLLGVNNVWADTGDVTVSVSTGLIGAVETMKEDPGIYIGNTEPSDSNVRVWIDTDDDVARIVDLVYPVGSIYMSVNSSSPAVLFGGTWERIQDTFLLAAGTNHAAGSTGGEESHTLTINEMPTHHHEGLYWGDLSIPLCLNSGSNPLRLSHTSSGADNGFLTGETGGEQAHNNMPPYLAVYVWKRTA